MQVAQRQRLLYHTCMTSLYWSNHEANNWAHFPYGTVTLARKMRKVGAEISIEANPVDSCFVYETQQLQPLRADWKEAYLLMNYCDA